MKRTTTWAVGAITALAVVAAGGVAVAAGTDDDVAITGVALEQASAAALAETGGGRVTDTEVGDEEGFYEVEVTLPDGQEVDVHLTEDFTVLGTEAEDEETEDDD